MSLKLKNDVQDILSLADQLQQEANKYNIIHVFDDGGYREFLMLKMFELTKEPGRHGDDAIDPVSKDQYELKTVNLINTSGEERKKPGITTCHHVNQHIIDRYRKVSGWLIGIFYINDPARIYEVGPTAFEPHFKKWENRLKTEKDLKHINNPKIPFGDVLKHGILHYHDPKYDKYFVSTSGATTKGKGKGKYTLAKGQLFIDLF